MATFSEMIKINKVKTVYLKKQKALAEISHNLKLIEELDTETPNVRMFGRFESEANNSLEMLKVASGDLNILLFDANPDIASDEDYIADLKDHRDQQIDLCNAIDKYTEILNTKGLKYPPDTKPLDNLGDLDKVLTTLVKSQDSNIQ